VRAISEHARQSTSSGRPSWDQASLEWRRKVSGARWSIVLATAGPIRTKYRDSFSLPVSLPLQPVSLATLRLSAAWMRGRWWSLRHAGYQWQSRRSCRIMNLSRKQSRTTSPLKSQHERCYWLSLSFSLVLSLSLSLSIRLLHGSDTALHRRLEFPRTIGTTNVQLQWPNLLPDRDGANCSAESVASTFSYRRESRVFGKVMKSAFLKLAF